MPPANLVPTDALPNVPPDNVVYGDAPALDEVPVAPPGYSLWLRLCGGLLAFYVAFGLGVWSTRHAVQPPLVGPFATQGGSAPAKTLQVHVAGQVRHPGVYPLPPNARVQDAIAQAGGPLPGADPNALNLAAWAEDGSRIEVPAKGTPPVIALAAAPAATSQPITKPQATASKPAPRRQLAPVDVANVADVAPHSINLNTATEAQFEALPGIGPVMARAILEYRRANGAFRTVDDLDNVRGIGAKKLEHLRPLVTVR